MDRQRRALDQTKLPTEETYVNCTTYQEVADVIRNMVCGERRRLELRQWGSRSGFRNQRPRVGELKREFEVITT
jgi:hypothetical protein